MAREGEFPADWDRMSAKDRTHWMALWLDANFEEHARIGKLNREQAEKERLLGRRIKVRGKRRKT